jgi:hypothetical protein
LHKIPDVEQLIEEGPSVAVRTGLGEFASEAASHFEERRVNVGELCNPRKVRLQENGQPDRELLHRLHEDMRRAMAEMRETQAATLAALSDLQANLIRWIVFTAIAVIVLLKLF